MTVLTAIGRTGAHAGGVTEHSGGEVPERARRRTFTAAYKLAVLAEYEAAEPGQRGQGAAPGGFVLFAADRVAAGA